MTEKSQIKKILTITLDPKFRIKKHRIHWYLNRFVGPTKNMDPLYPSCQNCPVSRWIRRRRHRLALALELALQHVRWRSRKSTCGIQVSVFLEWSNPYIIFRARITGELFQSGSSLFTRTVPQYDASSRNHQGQSPHAKPPGSWVRGSISQRF